MAQTFIPIANTDELPDGARLVVEIDDEWVVIFNVNGEYYALEDRCTHDEVALSEGEMDGYAVECPKHGARFDVRDGRVLSAPAYIPARPYTVRIVDGEIQIARR